MWPGSSVCSNRTRTRSNGLRLEHRKFHTNTLNEFFTVRVTEHWNRLPRGVVESPSMEIFKTCLYTYLCDLFQGTCFVRGVGLNDLLRAFPTPAILWFCDFVI